jgi:transposase
MGDVISVVARRRRWTLEQKLMLLEEVSRPGASIAVVADRHEMSRSLLFEWPRQNREGTMPGLVRAAGAEPLVPVRVVDAGVQPEAARLPPALPS